MFADPVRILIIDDNSPFVLPLLRSFSGYPKVQLNVLIFSRQKANYFRYSRYLKSLYQEDSFTDENFEKIVKEYVIRSSADLIIPTREWISKFFYKHQSGLQEIVKIHPVSDLNTIETLNDKWKLNSWLERNNFPSSYCLEISKGMEITKIVDSLSYPVLLKPFIGIGGKGIKLINSKENLKSALSENVEYSQSYFIQEYIEGYDIDISFFSINGEILFYTIQKGIVLGHLTYSKGIEFVKNKELFELTSSIVGKLEYTGIAHLDFRYDAKKGTYVLIDFNGRYWSSLEGSRIMGVNFPLLAVAYSMGVKFDYPDYSTGTYYLGTTAIKTYMRNLFSKNKYPIRVSHSELLSIVMDPVPEIVHTGEKIADLIKKTFSRNTI